jgi:hypothetical protein
VTELRIPLPRCVTDCDISATELRPALFSLQSMLPWGPMKASPHRYVVSPPQTDRPWSIPGLGRDHPSSWRDPINAPPTRAINAPSRLQSMLPVHPMLLLHPLRVSPPPKITRGPSFAASSASMAIIHCVSVVAINAPPPRQSTLLLVPRYDSRFPPLPKTTHGPSFGRPWPRRPSSIELDGVQSMLPLPSNQCSSTSPIQCSPTRPIIPCFSSGLGGLPGPKDHPRTILGRILASSAIIDRVGRGPNQCSPSGQSMLLSLVHGASSMCVI